MRIRHDPSAARSAQGAQEFGKVAVIFGGTSTEREVSLKHANFIINHGAATAHDLEQLVLQVQSRVQAAHGIALQPEVRIVGEAL